MKLIKNGLNSIEIYFYSNDLKLIFCYQGQIKNTKSCCFPQDMQENRGNSQVFPQQQIH